MRCRVVDIAGRTESEWDDPHRSLAHLAFDLDCDHMRVANGGNRAIAWREGDGADA